jgi:tRNA uridine 5-carboxymethylaminomethyl modification enzyme
VRLDAATVKFDGLEVQHGDPEPRPFSFMNDAIMRPRVPCWITYTNERIHELLRDNFHRAPLYSGQIRSVGPRYCPSIETKIVRFPDKKRHQVFLEPEEEEVKTIYCNGISTSVPRDVQDRMLSLLPGTAGARIIRYGYAIEYDYCPPFQLARSLETKRISGLFLAGQINGTSGYEEAAGQGLIAGINAARKLSGKEPLVLRRDQAYIGVMIDDLLTRDIDEPYRMFTSRAEYRLSLRSDNADRRLTPVGRQVGTVDDARWRKFREKLGRMNRLESFLRNTRRGGSSLWERLRRPDRSFSPLEESGMDRNDFDPEVVRAVMIDARYEGYLAKQQRLADDFQSLESVGLPDDLDYAGIWHLRAEARDKLAHFRPQTLGQASRIGGVTPADVTVIGIYLKKFRKDRVAKNPESV